MTRNCTVCSEILEEINVGDLIFGHCGSCTFLTLLNSPNSISQINELVGSEVKSVNAEESFSLEVKSLTIEDAWDLLSGENEITQGQNPATVYVTGSLGIVRNPSEFLEALEIILSDSGVIIITDSGIKKFFNLSKKEVDGLSILNFFSTYSLNVLAKEHDLEVVDVEVNEDTYKWHLRHKGLHPVSPTVIQVLGEEEELGIHSTKALDEYLSSKLA